MHITNAGTIMNITATFANRNGAARTKVEPMLVDVIVRENIMGRVRSLGDAAPEEPLWNDNAMRAR